MISLSMIVRNEGRTLERCLESVAQYVDEIVIGLAGESTDNTEEIARKFTDKIIPIEWHDHFADARNIVLEQCTGDWLLWLDGDDELINGDRMPELIEQRPQTGAFYFGYDYGRDEDDATHTWLWRERLVRADLGWKWKGRVHEIMTTPVPHDIIRVDTVHVKHHREGKNTESRNLRLLYQEIKGQEPNPEPHLLVYLGNELSARGQYEEAILHWERYLKISDFSDEEYQVRMKLARSYMVLREHGKARGAALSAITVKPSWPDAFLLLAELAFIEEKWIETVEWMKAASTKEPPQTTLIIDPMDYSYKPYVITGVAYARLGAWQEALLNTKAAYDVKPSKDLKRQIALLEDQVELEDVYKAFMRIYEHLGRNDEWLKARSLFSVTPKVLEQHPDVQEAWHRTMLSTAHIEDPSIMVEFYKNNPGWAPYPEDKLFSQEHFDYPRLAFARDVARSIKAKQILDFGCSDGFMALPLALVGHKVDGVDLDPRVIALASSRAVKYDLADRTSFTEGDIDTVMEWVACEKFFKYDLALAFEVIEHLADVPAFLDKLEQAAAHIAITTPHMAWERGRIAGWDKVEPKGHLRIFGLDDLERELTPRGRIRNLYVEPWADTGWIFADYSPGDPTSGNINFLAPGTLETFGPRKLDKVGLGGSETALIRLAEEFAEKHKNVTIYGNIDEPGYFSGVRYRDWDSHIPDVASDMSIAWRLPEAADLDLNTKRLVLWMHDTDAGDRLTEERASKFDSIVVLSEWHKQHMLECYPFLNPDNLRIIGNGVNRDRFKDHSIQRNPMRVVYASSPDRGLDVILTRIWPKVVEAVPEAELHIYYGWDSFDKAAERVPHLKEFKANVAEAFLRSKNVTQHGRVDQDELAKEMLASSIWLYPTYFYETYCITAVEAQLAGLIPITNKLAALNETVKSGIFIEGDVREDKVQEAYVKAVIDILKKSDDPNLRSRIIQKAPAMTWREVAKKWLN